MEAARPNDLQAEKSLPNQEWLNYTKLTGRPIWNILIKEAIKQIIPSLEKLVES